MWKNKSDKIIRSVIYQSLSSGGLNFRNFRTAVKSLRLSWLGRFLNRTNESWQEIPNDSFHRYGGLPFLLNCSYDSKLLDKQPPQSFEVKCWTILRNCVQVTLMSTEVNSFFGMSRKSRYRITLYFEHIFLRKESVLFKTCETKTEGGRNIKTQDWPFMKKLSNYITIEENPRFLQK